MMVSNYKILHVNSKKGVPYIPIRTSKMTFTWLTKQVLGTILSQRDETAFPGIPSQVYNTGGMRVRETISWWLILRLPLSQVFFSSVADPGSGAF